MNVGIVSNRPPLADILRRAVRLRPDYAVLWIARTAGEAFQLWGNGPPDLLLMDLGLTSSDGVEATRQIVARTGCPVLIVTDSVWADAARVFEAMGQGALEAVDAPRDGNDLRASAAQLLAKMDILSRRIDQRLDKQWSDSRPAASTHVRSSLIAIGASAGGPGALATVLRGLPKDFPAAIVIVQHLNGQFAPGMADWLHQHSLLPVMVAREGQCPAPGTVLLAGTDDHLTLKSRGRLGYTHEPDDCAYRPSVDVFFRSVGLQWPGKAVGVLLTGMGNDGAQGLKGLRSRGHHTIAQDEATSAVYGMPKAAAMLDAAIDILAMDRIASRLIELVGRDQLSTSDRTYRPAPSS